MILEFYIIYDMNPVRNIDLKPGKYVLAVSGGVDSVALLDLLAKKAELELIVAHFDHGIRPNSKRDCDFVAILADRYGLEFYSVQGELGIGASEETARKARYDFLRKIKNKVNAKAIITAHHQDDVIETAVINIIRGTTARGLGSLKSTKEIARPLLKYTKKEIIGYAKENNLHTFI